MSAGGVGPQNTAAPNEPQPLNRRRALRVLGALAAAAAGAAALSAATPERADAYSQTEGSTDFTGPIRATGGNNTIPDGAAVIGNNPNSGVGVYGAGSGTGIYSYGVYGAGSGTGTFSFGVLGSGGGGGLVNVGVRGNSGAGLGSAVSGSDNVGVLGSANVSGGIGVNGSNSGSDGFGVWAFANGANGVGVRGESRDLGGNGVLGVNSTGGTGVYGQSVTGSGNTNVGVYGQAQGSSGGIGVLGLCSNDANSVGVYAQSASGKGFLGFSNSVNGVGAVGVNSTSGIGLYGVSSGGFAGVFSGNLYVTGSQTVLGAKSAAVRDAGGKLRRMYSLESPESWFEDFGSGQLSGGSATVQLEPGFAGVVHNDGYRVFLTPQGDSNGLYVGSKTASGFTVREQQGGKSSVVFDYRVVAKRKDIAGTRLEHVEEPALPDIPEPIKPQALPAAPASPKHGG